MTPLSEKIDGCSYYKKVFKTSEVNWYISNPSSFIIQYMTKYNNFRDRIRSVIYNTNTNNYSNNII